MRAAEIIKPVLRALFFLFYRVKIEGAEKLDPFRNEPLILIANHVSLIDPPLLAAFLPGRPMFAIHSLVTKWKWLQPILALIDFQPLDPANPHALKSLVRTLQNGQQVVIFPEGRLSETAGLMKSYDGPALMAEKTGATVVPIWVEGTQYSGLTRLNGKMRRLAFPKITVRIGDPMPTALQATRDQIAMRMHDALEALSVQTRLRPETLYQSLCRHAQLYGRSRMAVTRVEEEGLTYGKLLQFSYFVGSYVRSLPEQERNIGVMMPTVPAGVGTFYAVQAAGRTAAMLNYTASIATLKEAIRAAGVQTILTSRRFIDHAELYGLLAQLPDDVKIVTLEDVKKRATLPCKLATLLAGLGLRRLPQKTTQDDPAVILFTSGSEGLPKPVPLTHRNLLANFYQVRARIGFNQSDIFFNCLPLFHSFGLMGSCILPIMGGVTTYLYPNPLHYRLVPELIYSSNATIMFSTDTFLNGYARHAHPYDFHAMRFIFSGAEKLKESTRQLYADQFGVRVMQGYGVTETSPVIAVNSPIHCRHDTVGRLLPCMDYKLEPVEGLSEGGRLLVRGANVMSGYVGGTLSEGWHDTGDIVTVDAQRFITIQGRAKRFAKMAGEMVSLSLTEQLAAAVSPQYLHGAIVARDERRGEQIVLYTTDAHLRREPMRVAAQEKKMTPLALPKEIVMVESMPLLATGKIDYVALNALARDVDAVELEPALDVAEG